MIKSEENQPSRDEGEGSPLPALERVRVQPRASFTPPESCPDCAAGVPFGPDGHHVNHNQEGEANDVL